MGRCCSPIPNEYEPCYASVLVGPDLKDKVSSLERGPLLPSFTAWCPSCQRPYLLTGAIRMFKKPSAHHAHILVLSQGVAGIQGVTRMSDADHAAA
jgi:hypothetical protein